jgi:hypothetical protein
MYPILRSFMVAMIACSTVFAQSERQATIQNLIGSVKVRKGDAAAWKDAKPKMSIGEKDAIRTFVESQAEIKTSEGSVIKLDENTLLEMATFKQLPGGSQATKVSIMTGSVLSNIKKLVSTQSRFEFETPTATASIRGTEVGFDVTSEKTNIKVYEGEVMVLPRGASAGVSVKTNQMATVVKGQQTASIGALSEKLKKMSIKPDSVRAQGADTARIDTTKIKKPGLDSLRQGGTSIDSAANKLKTGSARADTVMSPPGISTQRTAPLALTVTSPSDGQVITVPMIQVSGTATAGAEVSINGAKCQSSPSGAFSLKVPIPDEENTVVIEVEAALAGAIKKTTRQVVYKPALTLIVTSPQNLQTINATSVQVVGTVTPSKAEVLVSETKLTPASSGKFSGLVTIPDEEGRVDLNFEASYQGASKREIRTIVYKRLADMIKPTIQPTQLPKISCVKKISFTVFDKTNDDEITFYSSVDGSMSTETGQPNSSFMVELSEGIHHYTVYAEDKAHNRTTPMIIGDVGFLKSRPVLQATKPSRSPEVIHVPPGAPQSSFKPVYTVEVSIRNLPDNDMRLVKEATLKNESTGQVLVQRDLIDMNLYFDMELKRGENRLTFKVKDICDNEMQLSPPIMIDVR